MDQVSNITTRRDTDTFLRGVAVLCVVLIHFLSTFKKSPFITGAEYQTLAVSLDQLSRVAVPLFVALSGYGLMLRYRATNLKWIEFLKKRVWKLLPLYILWSSVYWIVFFFIPEWRPTAEMKPVFGQLLFGNADYHLYFVPMIFQLYLLFPFLLKAVKQKPLLMLILAGIFQVVFYYTISNRVDGQPGTGFFQSDQKQYFWFFSWIFYFIVGMCMRHVVRKIKSMPGLSWVVYSILMVSGFWLCFSAIQAINSGTDPLVALRFTRLEVLTYATSGIISLFLILERPVSFPKWSMVMGEHSYLLYLSHTLLLRILFLFIDSPLW